MRTITQAMSNGKRSLALCVLAGSCLSCCGGLLHPERFSDFSDQTGQFHFPGWRCLACGLPAGRQAKWSIRLSWRTGAGLSRPARRHANSHRAIRKIH